MQAASPTLACGGGVNGCCHIQKECFAGRFQFHLTEAVAGFWHKVWWYVRPESPPHPRARHLRVSVVPSLHSLQYFVPSLRSLSH